MTTHDVAVIGGGPAGSAAAIHLARAGRDVVVLDKATFPRDKCCGDGLTALALRLVERLGVDPGRLPSWIDVTGATVTGPRGHAVHFPMPDGPGRHAAVVRRIELDAHLLDLARDAGAEVRTGEGLRTACELDDRVTITTDQGAEVQARYVVAADGMWSPTRKALGMAVPGYRGEWHAFRAYFTDVGPRARRELCIWFEADLLPGYAWSFPEGDGTANFGFGVQRGGKVEIGDMGRVWEELLERPVIRDILGHDAVPEARHTAWPIPARVDALPRTARRTLFVGDAAAVTDVLTGEGIGQALLTGMLAAEAIGAIGPHGARQVTERYDRAVEHHLLADHRMSALLVRALQHRKGARAALRVAGASAWTRRNFGRWLFEDYPRAVLATPSRWHRGMLHGPGAFPDRTALDRTALDRTAVDGGPASGFISASH